MSRGVLQKLHRRSRYEKRTKIVFCTQSKKRSENRSSHFEPKISWISFSRGSGPPLITESPKTPSHYRYQIQEHKWEHSSLFIFPCSLQILSPLFWGGEHDSRQKIPAKKKKCSKTQNRKMMIVLQIKYNPYIQYRHTNRSIQYKISYPQSTSNIQIHSLQPTFLCLRSITGVPFDSVRRFRASLLLRTTCMHLCPNWVASCVSAWQTKNQKPLEESRRHRKKRDGPRWQRRWWPVSSKFLRAHKFLRQSSSYLYGHFIGWW